MDILLFISLKLKTMNLVKILSLHKCKLGRLNSKILSEQFISSSKICSYKRCLKRSLHVDCTKLTVKTKPAFDKSIPLQLKSGRISSAKVIGYWLLTCSGMVFVAVSLGGLTRLTESGLSMVTWKLLGEKIPTNEVLWQDEFQKYQKYPEFQILNKDMTIDDFKRIWWMEFIHRMWGRAIGAVFAFPACYFLMRRMIKPDIKYRICMLGSLIGCQGLMGWYMVKSGLENNFEGPSDVPRVSQYRLAAHLSLALIIYTGFLSTALDYLLPTENNTHVFSTKAINSSRTFQRFKMLTYFSAGMIFCTAISGAFVAGLDAGLIYNSFPKMSNKWIPEDILFMSPILINITENPTTVQFNHRLMAMLTLVTITSIGLMTRKYKYPGRIPIAVVSLLGTAYSQVLLGILTLLNHVPTHLAALHQSGSLILLSSITWLCHEIKFIKKLPK